MGSTSGHHHRGFRIVRHHGLHEPEINHLSNVGNAAALAEDDVGRLDIAVDQAALVSLHECAAHLREDVNDSGRLLRAVLRDEIVERETIQVLHRIVEDPGRGSAVVEDRDRVRVA